MVFHWSLSNKFSQVSMTLLGILTVLNNAVVWIVSTHLLISKSSSRFNNPSVTVPRAPISKVKVLIFLFTFLQFYCKFSLFFFFFFFLLLMIVWFDRLIDIKSFFCISKSQRGLCVLLQDRLSLLSLLLLIMYIFYQSMF